MAWAEVLVLAAGVVVGDCSELLPDEVLDELLDVAVVEEEVSEEDEVFEAVVDWVDVDTVVLA